MIAETAYLLKYVDKKASPKDFSNRWSIRQALIYHKSNLTTSQDTYILMRLSKLLGDMFRDLLSKRRAQERGVGFLRWSEIHTMAFSSVVVNWREYINWFGRGCFTTCKFIYLRRFSIYPLVEASRYLRKVGAKILEWDVDAAQFDNPILAAVEPTKLDTVDSVSSSPESHEASTIYARPSIADSTYARIEHRGYEEDANCCLKC
jgi:hypothetical protein